MAQTRGQNTVPISYKSCKRADPHAEKSLGPLCVCTWESHLTRNTEHMRAQAAAMNQKLTECKNVNLLKRQTNMYILYMLNGTFTCHWTKVPAFKALTGMEAPDLYKTVFAACSVNTKSRTKAPRNKNLWLRPPSICAVWTHMQVARKSGVNKTLLHGQKGTNSQALSPWPCSSKLHKTQSQSRAGWRRCRIA